MKEENFNILDKSVHLSFNAKAKKPIKFDIDSLDVAYAVHNLLVLSPIPLRISNKSILRLKERVAYPQSVFSSLISSYKIIRTRVLISLIILPIPIAMVIS